MKGRLTVRTAMVVLAVLLLLVSVPSARASIVIHGASPGIVAVNYSNQGNGYWGFLLVLDSMGRVWEVREGLGWIRDDAMDPPVPVSQIKSWDFMSFVTLSDEMWLNDRNGHWYSLGRWPGTAGIQEGPSGMPSASTIPNPTSGPCRVSFSLVAEGPVSIEVVDATGRIVRRLLDGPHPAGDYSLKWDGRDDAGRELPAGVYFTHVTTAERTTTGRVALAR
jgi:hypothetical protein